jgi:cytochrome c5
VQKPLPKLSLALSLAGAAVVIGSNAIAEKQQRLGETVFQQACFACHGTGLNGAPVIGDTYEWEDRINKGLPLLLENTLKGLNNMPPRGACADCSDEEIAAAVDYLISQ